MTKLDDGGPAFPVNTRNGGNPGSLYPHGGMTLRDWFAGQALVGLAANPEIELDEYVGKAVYAVADAMLAARESHEDTP